MHDINICPVILYSLHGPGSQLCRLTSTTSVGVMGTLSVATTTASVTDSVRLCVGHTSVYRPACSQDCILQSDSTTCIYYMQAETDHFTTPIFKLFLWVYSHSLHTSGEFTNCIICKFDLTYVLNLSCYMCTMHRHAPPEIYHRPLQIKFPNVYSYTVTTVQYELFQ